MPSGVMREGNMHRKINKRRERKERRGVGTILTESNDKESIIIIFSVLNCNKIFQKSIENFLNASVGNCHLKPSNKFLRTTFFPSMHKNLLSLFFFF